MGRKRRKKVVERKNRMKRKKKSREAYEKRQKKAQLKKKAENKPLIKKMAILSVVVVILLLLSLFGLTLLQQKEGHDWTVMVYMAGDNNLDHVIDQNLEAMMEVGSDDRLSIVALVDGGQINDGHLYFVKKGKVVDKGLKEIVSHQMGELYTSDPKTLSDFGKWALKTYPADNNMLIMWGHGKGWMGLASDRGGSSMTLPEFNEALEDIVRENQGKKLEIIGFDACAMATMEGYYQVGPYAKYLVASEKKEPDAGWPYQKILNDIKKGRTVDPESVVRSIVKKYVRSYKDGELPHQDFSVGMTGLRTSNRHEFVQAFQRLSLTLAGLGGDDGSKVHTLGSEAPRFENRNDIDLLAFVKSIQETFSAGTMVNIQAGETLAASRKAIVAEDHWSNPSSNIKMKDANGICIHFPSGSVDDSYSELIISQVTHWYEFLKT